jgi:hypothetical protein
MGVCKSWDKDDQGKKAQELADKLDEVRHPERPRYHVL